MTRMSNGGKGSDRRPGAGYGEGHDRIFGAKPPKERWVPPPLPGQNKRHDIDPAAVQVQMEKKIAEHQADSARGEADAVRLTAKYLQDKLDGTAGRNWIRKPATPEEIKAIYSSWIERERGYYAKVRVIELPKPGKRFVLAYGDQDDAKVTSGTGPFDSFDTAAKWYLSGGR